MDETSVRVGEVLLDKYRVERVLGEGGMGLVVLATHTSLDERVAIKFLKQAALSNQQVVARFLQEARAAVRIKSEHVAKVFDVGTMPTGEPYMVMEYLAGADLAHELVRGPIGYTAAADYIVQACEALAQAHAQGIIHRDLKPANLFLTRREDGSPCVKLLDFGISKASLSGPNSAEAALTQTSTSMGTPYYMSPEQMRSAKHVDARSDIWSLGTTLYELLAGKPPFAGQTVTEVCAMILADPPPPLRDLHPEMPPDLEAVVLKCLEKDPAKRYQNVAELSAALAPFCSDAATPLLKRIPAILGLAPQSQAAPQSNNNQIATASTVIAVSGAAPVQPAAAPSKLPLTLVAGGVGLALVILAGALAIRASQPPVVASEPPPATTPVTTTSAATGPTVVPVAASEAPPARSAAVASAPTKVAGPPPGPGKGPPAAATTPTAPVAKPPPAQGGPGKGGPDVGF